MAFDFTGGEELEKKSPELMRNRELLEVLSHYIGLGFRMEPEQEYLAQLRLEVLRRMEAEEVPEDD